MSTNLPADAPQIVDLIEELTARFHAGQAVDVEVYVRAYPHYAEAIRRLLPALEALGDLHGTAEYVPARADSLEEPLAVRLNTPRAKMGARRAMRRDAEGESGQIVKATSDVMPAANQTGDRYQLAGEIARGGMGAVLRARDVDLGRDLAMKVLLEKYADRPDVARRFIEEARIGGQLQHPGVVPVYDIGRFGDRPFFTMKLVQGRTLASILAERTSAAEDRPRLLNIALLVAQTLAYAHAKGVIHRDLKPANIMVGAFGEVQVMDWGLAKVLAEGGIADEERPSRKQEHAEHISTIRKPRSDSTGGFGSDTEAGTILGTPAYMPPEQAKGEIANLDPRADVFGLGAILCEILTGRPPYGGQSFEEVRRKATSGELTDAHARLEASAADPELIALSKTCLASQASDRPANAQAVADALTKYLDGVQERLHRAELAEAEANARALEEAKRRKLALALAATVLLAVGLGGGSWLWIKADRDARRAQVTRDVNDALNRVTALREQAKASMAGVAPLFAEARAQAQRALALVENAPADPELVARVQQVQAELDLEEKDRKLIAELEEAYLAQADTAVGESRFAREQGLPRFRKALHAYGLPAGEGEPRDVAENIRRRPLAVREAVIMALDEWIDLATNPTYGIREPDLGWLRAVAVAAEPDNGWTRQFRIAQAERDESKRLATLEQMADQADVSTLPVRAVTRLAWRLQALHAGSSAIRLLERAQQEYPADFWVNHQLGVALRHVDPPQPEMAVRCYMIAVALRPGSAAAHRNLGNELYQTGKVDEALFCYRKALQLDPKDAPAVQGIGEVLEVKGQVQEAVASYRKAIELNPNLHHSYTKLGGLLLTTGQHDEAITCLRKARELAPGLPHSEYNLGLALDKAGRFDDAIACYSKAIEMAPEFPLAHNSLGLALRRRGQLDQAITCFRKAIERDLNFRDAHLNLGEAVSQKGEVDAAIVCFRKAIELDPQCAMAYTNLGASLVRKGEVEEAIVCLRKAIAIEPRQALALCNLAEIFRLQGQIDDAIAYSRQAIDIEPRLAAAHFCLGRALGAIGKTDDAIAHYGKVLEIDPNHVRARLGLGAELLTTNQFDNAAACFRAAIELDPQNALSHALLGRTLGAKGKYTEARGSFIRAFELLSADDPLRQAISDELQGCDRLVRLEERLPNILHGQDKPGSAEQSLELVKICYHKRLFVAAARLSAETFAAVPNLADDRQQQHRYNAACAAALAASGQAEDDPPPDDAAKAQLRKQALDWLRAELAAWKQFAAAAAPDSKGRIVQILTHWKKDPDLAGIRDEPALGDLPTDERGSFNQLWNDVDALLLELSGEK